MPHGGRNGRAARNAMDVDEVTDGTGRQVSPRANRARHTQRDNPPRDERGSFE
jgi:hypothetical protein